MEVENKYQEVAILSNLYDTDGSINVKSLKDLIRNHISLQANSAKVYDTITKGLLKHSGYPADTVLSIYGDLQRNLIDKTKTCEDILQIVTDEETKKLISEYFGKDEWADK